MISNENEKKLYIDYLIKEIEMKKNLLNDITTIYIGGGTPSILSNNLLEKLFIHIFKYVDINKLIEFTIECNPLDIVNNTYLMKLFKKYHINRVSLGVQSLNNDKLLFIHRNHKCCDVFKAIDILQENGIENINCDLIYGLNTDTYELIQNDINCLIKKNITHLSCYTLIVENKTILNKMIKEYNYKPLEDDKEYEIYKGINKLLKDNGFIHYEVSNYAKKGYESLHNLTYWLDEYYIGLGANASYYYNNTRYTNINNLKKYYEGIDNNNLNYSEQIEVNIATNIYERIMLGLRLLKGIDVNKFSKDFDIDLLSINKIKSLIDNNIMGFDGNNLYVCENSIYVLNEILIRIIGEIC